MFGFCGFMVHANDIRTQGDAIAASVPTGLSAPAVWDALPDIAKWQIILFVGCLEWYDEYHFANEDGTKPKHYMRGGMPGKYPDFDGLPLNLFDPFKLFKRSTDEQKAKGRLAEINNGRLAMIGMMGFVAEAKVPGSVPALKGLVGTYNGNIMVPFEADFSLFGTGA